MYHTLSITKTIELLHTDAIHGLTTEEARHRLARHGKNELPHSPERSFFSRLVSQFQNVFVAILFFAAGISVLVGEYMDAIVIFMIVLINGGIGFFQELQAKKSLDTLKNEDVHWTLVLRNSLIEKILVSELVPGDCVLIEEGETIPADARVIESFSLQIDESILTGESLPVTKHAHNIAKNPISIAERQNIVHKGTHVISGRGKAIIIATGADTEMGKIAQALQETSAEETPLTKELNNTAKTLTIIIIWIAIVLFFLNILRHESIFTSLLISIAISVAAIPEGIPAIVAIVLSFGVTKLAKRKTIVKKLAAVETLGAVQIIATDKTGTITQNKVNVVSLWLKNGQHISIQGNGYEPTGIFLDPDNVTIKDPQSNALIVTLLTAGCLTSNATVTPQNTVLGDTTEAALIVAAKRAALSLNDITTANPRIYEKPFTSERRKMSVIVKIDGTSDHMLYTKGAPEVLLEKCSSLSKEKSDQIKKIGSDAAKQGMRCLMLARKKLTEGEIKDAIEKDILDESPLEYVGLVGMQDPMRPEVPNAIAAAKQAGIRTIMITGDHPDTAREIACQAGIMGHTHDIFTEEDLGKHSLQGIANLIADGACVFARISPLGKLKIIKSIKLLPHTHVAVTGDGVNDTPALKAAHIGIAMGISGTDLTKEIADMVITDDNYATIITAIEEGRIIFSNLVKFIRYLISCNISEVILISLGVGFGYPLIITPIQMLWINVITDSFPALALGFEPNEQNLMHHPPRDISQGILHRKRWVWMMIEGCIMGLLVFFLFFFMLKRESFAMAQSVTFVSMGLFQLVQAINHRSIRKSIFQMSLWSNPWLLAAITFSAVLQWFATQISFANKIFQTHPIDTQSWFLILVLCFVPLIVSEVRKSLSYT